MFQTLTHNPAAGEASKEYDFIVAGGGTAGLVVAGRLAENPNVKVLVIEAGVGNPEDVPGITTPAQAMELRGTEHDWQYKCEKFINAPDWQRVEMKNTRGKVLGGSSNLNYYTWLPGSAAIYDEWAAYGGEGWKYENFKDYFKKSNTYHDDNGVLSSEIAKKLGGNGPLHIAPSDLVEELQPFRKALEQAWESKGNKVTEDVYSGHINGLVHCVTSIYDGQRTSSVSFVRGKPNVTIQAQSIARKILFEDKVATGVQIQDKDGNLITYKAKKEVIISGGVFESPKLLMLSGIGPDDQLFAHQIGRIVESPHVGQNLIDHPIMPHVFKLKNGYGLDDVLLRKGHKQDVATNVYKETKRGPWSSGLLELVGFPRIDERLEKREEWQAASAKAAGKDPFGPQGQPHFEIDFVPMWSSAFQWHFPQPSSGDYLTVILDLLRPQSRGEVRLASANPLHAPYIDIGFFAEELDLVVLREGIRFIDDVIMNGDGMKDIIEGDWPWPMPRDNDEEMRKQILERASTGFHPCGTARMGKNISDGVVDGELKVFGVDKLRVIDASIIPLIPDGRIQAPVYALAEKGADMIKATYPDLYS